MGVSTTAADLLIAGNAFERLSALHQSLYRNVDLPSSARLFHYTTADGLKGIVENNQLWATSAYFQNDSAEIRYGYGVLHEALAGWVNSAVGRENSLSCGLAQDLARWFKECTANRVVPPVFLSCFCEDGNLLTQWRAYGSGGGYALEFTFLPHEGGFRPEPRTYTVRLSRVEYRRAEQIRRCRDILDAALGIIDEPDVARAIPNVAYHGRVNYDAFLGLVADMLMEEAATFKDEPFNVEKEWRLVVRRSGLLNRHANDGVEAGTPVHFRSARGYLIPYVRLLPLLGRDRIPLRSVRAGPALDPISVILSMHPFLDNHGFQGVQVLHSGISARF